MKTEQDLKIPAFLMCAPYNLATTEPNNIWMHEMSRKELEVNVDRAISQWFNLYSILSTSALVKLIPTVEGLQDQVYVANLGIMLPHLSGNKIVVSNFLSPPRRGEQPIGIKYFSMNNKNVYTPSETWEGEADLKFVRDNLYIGGYGQRTNPLAYDWFERSFDMKIIRLKMVDEYLYHLDCSVFPLNTQKVLVCTSLYEKQELEELEKHVEIVDVPIDDAYYGATNSCRVGSMVLSHSNLFEYRIGDEHYQGEKHKTEFLTKACEDAGLEPMFVNISEFMKSGAMLSCMIMHLNYHDYSYPNQ